MLRDVRAAVEDWPKIVELARVTIKGMKAGEAGPEGMEARAFLEWMVADHFTFLGQRDYELVQHDIGFGLRAVPGSGLGILRDALRPAGAAGGHAVAAGRRRYHLRLVADLPDQGQFARDGASAGLSGLRRHQADRRGRQGDRRAALYRPVYVHRVPGVGRGDSDRAAQMREHRTARRFPAERAIWPNHW